MKLNTSDIEAKKVLRAGTSIIREDKEPCLTCGSKKRLLTIEKNNEDKPVVVKYCMLCLVKNSRLDCSTAANREEKSID
jgi:hypothetical protein